MTEVIYDMRKWTPQQIAALKIAAGDTGMEVKILGDIVKIVGDNFPSLFTGMIRAMDLISETEKTAATVPAPSAVPELPAIAPEAPLQTAQPGRIFDFKSMGQRLAGSIHLPPLFAPVTGHLHRAK